MRNARNRRPFGWAALAAVVLLPALLPGSSRAQGDEDKKHNQFCVMPFQVVWSAGPDAGKAQKGVLAYAIERGGAIESGSFVGTNGKLYRVVGQATGRAISLMFHGEDGSRIHGTGSAAEDVLACGSDLAGTAVGLPDGDLGYWEENLQLRVSIRSSIGTAFVCKSGVCLCDIGSDCSRDLPASGNCTGPQVCGQNQCACRTNIQ